MEFNRLLSQAISLYGESNNKIKNVNKKTNQKKIDLKKLIHNAQRKRRSNQIC